MVYKEAQNTTHKPSLDRLNTKHTDWHTTVFFDVLYKYTIRICQQTQLSLYIHENSVLLCIYTRNIHVVVYMYAS